MQPAQASRTAFRVAVRRAAHQLLDAPLVLADPIAVPIIGDDAARALRESPGTQQDRFARAARAFMVARARAAEDALADAHRRGVRQFVVLGAGLDTFAYRNPYDDLHVFEVDHPATQQWKRESLARAGIALPASLTFAPVNFEVESLADGLAAAGFREHESAFFSWLGVSMYLTREAFDTTLGYLAATGPGGGVAFDYAVPRASLSLMERLVFDRVAEAVARAGEPFTTFLEPAEVAAVLTRAGFSSVHDLTADEINQRYFSNRGDGLAVRGRLGRVAVAMK